jgi:hypothetical protein
MNDSKKQPREGKSEGQCVLDDCTNPAKIVMYFDIFDDKIWVVEVCESCLMKALLSMGSESA